MKINIIQMNYKIKNLRIKQIIIMVGRGGGKKKKKMVSN